MALCIEEVTKHLMTTKIGQQIIYKKETETTMDDAKLLGKQGCQEGTLVIAETQTKARGSKNHKWNAMNSGNIYASVVLYKDVKNPTYLDKDDVKYATSLAIYQTLQDIAVPHVCMKWPNDIWVRGHKIAGVLVEAFNLKDQDKFLYVDGFGLNVNSDIRRIRDLQSYATSVSCELGETVSREKLLASLCNHLELNLSLNRSQLFDDIDKAQLFQPGHSVICTPSEATLGTFTGVVMEMQKTSWQLAVRKTGEIWTLDDQQYSVRPLIVKFIYVYTGQKNDPTSLHHTLSALVDLSKVSIKTINEVQLETGDWMKDAALVLIGDSILNSKMAREKLMRYIHSGGSLMATAKGASQFCNCNYWNLENEMLMEGVKITRCNNDDKNQLTFLKITCPGSKCFTGVSFQGGFQFKIPPTTGFTPLAHYGTGRNTDGVATFCRVFGNGHLVVCGFEVEATYTDVQDSPQALEMRESVSVRDRFVEGLLKELLQKSL